MVVVLHTLMTCQSRGFASSIDQGPGEMNTDAGGLSMDLKDPSNHLLGISRFPLAVSVWLRRTLLEGMEPQALISLA